MSTHNICFYGELRKISIPFGWKKVTYPKLYSLFCYTIVCKTFIKNFFFDFAPGNEYLIKKSNGMIATRL